MQKSFIFTEAFNCAKILNIALKSFHAHHDLKVHIFGTLRDFEELDEIKEHANNIFHAVDDKSIERKFAAGHAGTAEVFAKVLYNVDDVLHNEPTRFTNIIHFDSDIYFRKESISLIEAAFDEGFDVIGSRRCYANNPADIKGLDGIPDTISTYFFGIRTTVIPVYRHEYFVRMCQGAANPAQKETLDFFDGVTHAALAAGAKIKFLDFNLIGGQNEHGKKTNNYTANLHLDCGDHLIHFGGVGSGYAFATERSNPVASYAHWALGRWALFAKLFYNQDFSSPFMKSTVYKSDGRWVDGTYDESIFNQLKALI